MRSVLVVDDASTVRSYHRSILAAEGFSVSEAVNGYEALELALTEPFDLFVVDINMPCLDGYGFVARLRREAVRPDAGVIMVSAERADEDVRKAYAAGANIYFTKPVCARELVAAALVLTGARGCASSQCASSTST